MRTPGTEHVAMIAIAFSGFAWGLYWIPLRALDAEGITGSWAIVVFYLLPLLLLLPVIVIRRRHLLMGGRSLHVAGMLAGVSLVFYAKALVFTDVVRALLLFYLTPLWSSFLSRLVIGEPITRDRWITIALALLGLCLILRLDDGFSIAFNIGDWMGLASGIVWAMAAVWMKSDDTGSGLDFTLSYFLWGSALALLLTLMPLGAQSEVPDLSLIWKVLPWFLPVVLILIIPPAFAVMWGATILSPGLLSILFMTEISAGAVTAAIWANEPFGWREASGVVLITAAGLWEPVRQVFVRVN